MKDGKRLGAARAALRAVEDQQGVRSYRERTLSPTGSGFGAYHLDRGLPDLVAALREAAGDHSWIAAIGIRNMGWEAAGENGVPLERLVRVECPQQQVTVALSTLLEAFDIVAVGDYQLLPTQQRTLAARARKLERIIFTISRWPFITSAWTDPQPWGTPANREVV